MNARDERQFEEVLLEAALRERAKTEPRAGLEERILSSLEARRAPRFARVPRWAWVFAAGAAAGALAAIIFLHRPAALRSPAPLASATEPAAPVKPEPKPPLVAHVPPPAANSKTVRLSVFPAPRPLSLQERLLLAYVKRGRQAEAAAEAQATQPLYEDLKIPKLDVAALDIKPIEGSQDSAQK